MHMTRVERRRDRDAGWSVVVGSARTRPTDGSWVRRWPDGHHYSSNGGAAAGISYDDARWDEEFSPPEALPTPEKGEVR